MVYSAFTSGEVDQDSPLDATFFTKMKDNFDALEDGSAFDNSIDQSGIANSSVGQGELKSTTQQCDVASSSVDDGLYISDKFLMTGGQYTLGYTFGGTGSTSSSISISVSLGAVKAGNASDWTTENNYLDVIRSNTAGSSVQSFGVNCDVRYVQASPPYDLGDGEIPLFVFIKLDKDKKIAAISTATDPPWMHNGPTKTQYNFKKKGRKYRVEKYLSSEGDVIEKTIPITQLIKNADMDKVPHPFVLAENESVVLLDPVETLEILEFSNAGERVSHLLFNDYLRLDNTPINRACPNGVMPCRFMWRDTKRKAGAAVADRRQAAVEK